MFFNRSLVAIDIGSSGIKMLELSGPNEQRQLKNFAMELLPRGSIENGLIIDSDAVIGVLKKMVSRLGIKGRFASVAVSGNGILIKRVKINAGKDATIEEQVNFHAAQAFQLDLSELYYDFATIGASMTSQDEIDVLLVGARREVVEQNVKLIKGAGLNLGCIESGAVSIANMFEVNYGTVEGLVTLISIGASNTQISFINSGRFLYSQEVPFGGDAYSQALAQNLSLPWESAEALKISVGINPASAPPEVLKIINDTNELLVSDLKQMFSFFSSSSDAEGVGQVKYAFLTGGACRTLGLDAAIAAAIGVPVHLSNPFQKIEVAEGKFKLDQVMALSPMFGVAVGLGIRTKGDKVAA